MRAFREACRFLAVLALVQLGVLAVVLFCAAEVLADLGLWFWAFYLWMARGHPLAVLLPIGFTFGVGVQCALWQYAWLRLAQQGRVWRGLAEVFATSARHPVVRLPHRWE
jgi:hypothetical protein